MRKYIKLRRKFSRYYVTRVTQVNNIPFIIFTLGLPKMLNYGFIYTDQLKDLANEKNDMSKYKNGMNKIIVEHTFENIAGFTDSD